MLSANGFLRHLLKLVLAALIFVTLLSIAVQSVWRLARPAERLADQPKLKSVVADKSAPAPPSALFPRG